MTEAIELESVSNPVPEHAELHAATVKDSLSKNVLVDASSRLIYMLSRFCVPPFVLARVSLEAYGLWSTAFILVSYVGISTLGISNVYIKYIAEYAAKRKYQAANSLVSTGLLLTTPICLILFASAWFGWPFLADWFHVAPYLRTDAREVILSVLGIFLVSICLAPFHDILAGVQQTALVQYIRTISYLVETALIFVLVGQGRGIRGLAEAYVVRNVLEIAISAPLTFKKLPWLRISPRLCSREAIRNLFGFGSIVQIQSLLAIFLDSVERAIAAPLLGLGAAGLLEISQKLPTMAGTLPLAFANSFLPAASYLQHGYEDPAEQQEAIRKLYLKGSRYMNLAAGYISGFVALLPLALFQVWLGKTYPGGVYLMVLFTIAAQTHLLTGPGTSILRGVGRPHEEFYYCIPNVIALLVTVPLSWLVLGKWTILGIGTAVPISTFVAAVFFVRHANRVLGVPFRTYFKTALIPGLAPYLLAACFSFPVTYLVEHSSRWMGAGWLLLGGLLYTVALALLVDRLVWERGERLWFHATLAKYLSKFRCATPAVDIDCVSGDDKPCGAS